MTSVLPVSAQLIYCTKTTLGVCLVDVSDYQAMREAVPA